MTYGFFNDKAKADLYSKDEIDNGFYNKTQSDNKYPNKTDVYTKTQSDNKYPDKNDVYPKSNLYNKSEIDDMFDGIDFDMEGKANNRFPSLWLHYSTKLHTASWISEISQYISDDSYASILINPALNIIRVTALIEFVESDDNNIANGFTNLGFNTSSGPTWLPLFRLGTADVDEYPPTSQAQSWFGHMKITKKDGTTSEVKTSCGILADGSFCVYTYIGTLGNWEKIFIDFTDVGYFGGTMGRYGGYTAEECRTKFCEQALRDEGKFIYLQTGLNDTVADPTYMDCSGEVWRAAWYGAGIPMIATGGTGQVFMGSYVTSAKVGEVLDISKMLPGDIIGIGRRVDVKRVFSGTDLQADVQYTRPFQHYYHMGIYLGNNEYIHMGSKCPLFPEGYRTAGTVSPVDNYTRILNKNIEFVQDGGKTRMKGPYAFWGADRWHLEDEGDGSLPCYRVVIRLFPDIPDYMIG